MPEYLSIAAPVAVILLIFTILLICFPDLKYRRRVKKLKKRLRKIKWDTWEYSLTNLNAFRKFDPEAVMQRQAFTNGFTGFLQNIKQKKAKIEELDSLYARIPTRRVRKRLIEKEKFQWETAKNQQEYIASCLEIVWTYSSPRKRKHYRERATFTREKIESFLAESNGIKTMMEEINLEIIPLSLEDFQTIRNVRPQKDGCGCFAVITVPKDTEKEDVLKNYQHIYIGQTMNSIWDQAMKCVRGTLPGGKDIYDAIHINGEEAYICLVPCKKEVLNSTKAMLKDYFAAKKG